MICASAILERSLSEAIELHAMALAPDERGTWTGRDEQPLVPHRGRVLFALGGPAARRSLYQACVRAGLADLTGPSANALRQPWPRNGRPIPAHVVELDRLQVGGMY